MNLDTITHMSALDYLRTLPDNSVHCCVTSPPYYGLRDYSADGQIGLEDTPAAFVAQLVEVFEEVRRVLRGDGTCWVNLGDSYSSGHRTTTSDPTNTGGAKQGEGLRRAPPGELASKQLLGIPWRVAFALQDAGWWLRSDIIWHKPNPMPESVTDRPTKAHEYVFLLTKSARYFYDADAIREPVAPSTIGRGPVDFGGAKGRDYKPDKDDPNYRGGNEQWGRTFDYKTSCANGRNKRTVWTVATEPSSLKHFAMFPQALIEPMILAGCPLTVCSECGAGYVRVVESISASADNPRDWQGTPLYQANRGGHSQEPKKKGAVGTPIRTYIDQRPSCDCNAPTDAGIVIDPFMGTGTTALVAQRCNRHWLGCDVNAKTVELANNRTKYRGEDKRMLKEQKAGVEQLDMFNK